MICEKCGKELPENETVCSCMSEDVAAEQTETIETVAEETVEPAVDMQELGAPVSVVVRGKRGKARVVIGIVALVLMVATLVVSLLSPVLILGEWKVNQTIPTGATADLQVESTMVFAPSGESTWTDTLVNYKEVGYPEEGSKIENQFTYAVTGDKLALTMAGGEQQAEQKLEVFFSINPGQLSYWPEGGSPRTVYDYYRSGIFYPSMYLWLAAFILLVLGVLLLAIPGKKHEITVREDEEEIEEMVEETFEEAAEEVVEEVTETIEETTAE
ncbi:MAG: hypothetical protein J6A61_00025 [Clostridia bacterium]|nr:hypothetical protein [Clostridia bacterium]